MPLSDYQFASRLREAEDSLACGHHMNARVLCEQLLHERRHDRDATRLLAKVAWDEGEHDEAITLLQQYVRRKPRDIQFRGALGSYLLHRGRYREAIREFERVARHGSNVELARCRIARAHEEQGDLKQARAILEPIVRHDGTPPEAILVWARILLGEGDAEAAVGFLQSRPDQPGVEASTRRHRWHTLGQALEKLGRVDEAFEAYRTANTIEQPTYDVHIEETVVERLMSAFSAERLRVLPPARNNDERMIFIVSRPRAGSTLIERILGAHPDVHTAGETTAMTNVIRALSLTTGSSRDFPECMLDFRAGAADRLAAMYLERLGRAALRSKRVTDKHLFTWQRLGLVQLLFPRARVIDLRRDPVDNCFACYTAALGEQYPFSFDLHDLGFAHRQYERLMDHWHRELSIPIIRVEYEALVSDPEPWTRKLLEFCDLPWHDACLQFHAQRATATRSTAAPTLSYQQVQQPIYTRSVGRAAPFAAHLGPLYEALGQDAPTKEAASEAN